MGRVASGGRVLIVDADIVAASALTQELARQGYAGERAGTCLEAILLAALQHYAAAIIGMNLPDGSGGRLCGALHLLRPNLPIVLSADRDPVASVAMLASVLAVEERPAQGMLNRRANARSHLRLVH